LIEIDVQKTLAPMIESAEDFAASESHIDSHDVERERGCSAAGAVSAEQADDTAARETEAEGSWEGVASRSWLKQKFRWFLDGLVVGWGVVT